MAETVTRLPIKAETKPRTTSFARAWYPIEGLRQEIERLFDDFGAWPTAVRRSLAEYQPFSRFEKTMTVPAVDIAEKDNEYEITAEVPGLDEKDIEVKLADGGVLIKGEKKVEKEEKKKDYVLSERQYGSFERYFGLPDGVDTDKISATFSKGVLKVSVPKAVDALKQEKKIPVKAA